MNEANIDLNDVEKQVLTVVVRSLGASVFELKNFLGLPYGRSYIYSVLKLALLGLCKKGWVIRMRRTMGETMYCIPYDRYIEHMTASSTDMLSRLTPIDQDPIIVDCEAT